MVNELWSIGAMIITEKLEVLKRRKNLTAV
jgi:hypothetical protein